MKNACVMRFFISNVALFKLLLDVLHLVFAGKAGHPTSRVPSRPSPNTHTLALLINSTEAGNLLRGNGALHSLLDARTCAGVQLVLVTRMSICLIARLLVQATPQSS
jgi:hypothetical protein